jgi:hypothetical protein
MERVASDPNLGFPSTPPYVRQEVEQMARISEAG